MKLDKNSIKNVVGLFSFGMALNLTSNAYAQTISSKETINETFPLLLIPVAGAVVSVTAFGINYYKKKKEKQKVQKILKRELNYVHEENEEIKLIF